MNSAIQHTQKQINHFENLRIELQVEINKKEVQLDRIKYHRLNRHLSQVNLRITQLEHQLVRMRND